MTTNVRVIGAREVKCSAEMRHKDTDTSRIQRTVLESTIANSATV